MLWHPRQHLERWRQVAAAQITVHRVQHQLRPQFDGLTLDDEQYFVVIRRTRQAAAIC